MDIIKLQKEYIMELCDKKDEYIVTRCLEDLRLNKHKYGELLDWDVLTRERLKEIIKNGLRFEEMMRYDNEKDN